MSDVPNPIIVDAAGTAGSGYVLKAFLPGSTTNTSIFIDANGGSPQATITANAEGKWEVSGNEILPYIDRKHKWGIFANASDATANSPFYMGPFDNVDRVAVGTETNTTTATTTTMTAILGLAVGANVKTAEFSTGNGGGGTYDVVLTSGVTTNTFDIIVGVADALISFVLRVDSELDVKQLGVVGDGTTDNSDGIQRAEAIMGAKGGGTILLTPNNGDYRVSKHAGTNDKWGIKIENSNIQLIAVRGASLRRLDADISTFVKAFPILLIGVPDDDLIGSQITDILIEGIHFIGEDTRHASSGQAVMDGRQAIWVKNTKTCKITGNKFTAIDSGAIYQQAPVEANAETSGFYNKTKNYNITITNNDFIATSHSTAGRALMHTIRSESDNNIISDNYFEWCDVCASLTTTYDDYDDKETDTYSDSNLGTVNRSGKGFVLKGNMIYNSSEHCVYLSGMGIVFNSNVISVDDITVCDQAQIQIRGRGINVTGNELVGVHRGININVGSIDVVCSSNSIQAFGDSPGGVINITSNGLTGFLDARSDFFDSSVLYKPMRNITVSDNIIEMVDASQTNGVAIRLFTDNADANFPDGQMVNVNIKGNTISRPRKAILFIANLIRNCSITNNIFNGKDFIEAGFNGSTVQNSEYVIGLDDSLLTPLIQTVFKDNIVYGFENIFFDDGGAGGAGTMDLPRGMTSNKFEFIQVFSTAAFKKPTYLTQFSHNTGRFFLDRTQWFSSQAVFNSMFDGGVTTDSDKKSMLTINGAANVRAYIDDVGTFVQLG